MHFTGWMEMARRLLLQVAVLCEFDISLLLRHVHCKLRCN